MNYRSLTQFVTALTLISLLLPQNVCAEDPQAQTRPPAQTQTQSQNQTQAQNQAQPQTPSAEPTETEVSKPAEQPAKQATFQVSTDKNMERKRGSLAIGLGLKRKGILLLPVLHMKAQQPSLKEKATTDSAVPAAD